MQPAKAELQARYEKQEQEVLLPAVAAAKAETEEAAASGFYAREEAMEEVAGELRKFREEQSHAILTREQAQEDITKAVQKENLIQEMEDQAAAEVSKWEAQLAAREQELHNQQELREEEYLGKVKTEQQLREQGLALRAAEAAAKAETEEAAARGFYAREEAMQEVAGELRRFREEQSYAILSREQAQEAIAKAVRQESLTQEMEDQAAEEVSKWEAQLAAREQDLRSQQEHREREYLGEAKTEQQLASALRVRELALKAGEEDLRAKLRSREHVILQEQREMEGLEKRAEEMMALAQKRRQHLLVEEQKEAEALELRAQEKARELLADAEQRRELLQAEARKEAEKGLEAARQRAEEMLRSAEERREQARMLPCTFVIRGVVYHTQRCSPKIKLL